VKRLLTACLGLCVASCTAGPDYVPPSVPIAPSYRAAGGSEPIRAEWWRSFESEMLSRLQDEALVGNLSIEQALARVDQARAALGYQRANRLPAAQAEASVARARQSTNSGIGLLSRVIPDYPRTITDASIGVGATWEIDFAGGNQRRGEIARAGYNESVAAFDAARLSVAANLADAYWAWRSAVIRHAQYRELVAIARRQDAILKGRVRLGHAPEQALLDAAAGLAELEAGLEPLAADIKLHEFRILVLLGRPVSQGLGIADALQGLPTVPNPAIGIPADLLGRRPDVVMAEQRLIAANAQIGLAMSEYYPKISLTALLGSQSAGLDKLPTPASLAFLAGAGLRWRLFDFGRVDAQIEGARGQTREALAAYRQSALQASADVEACFALLDSERTRLQRFEASRAGTAASLEIDTQAYKLGARSLEAILQSKRRLAEADLRVLAVHESALKSAVGCYRAMGVVPSSRSVVPGQAQKTSD
jgi:NodT family efflux transporter outer membrane factor (OMF) lipoprotein